MVDAVTGELLADCSPDEARQIMEAYDAYCRKLDAYGQELFRELFGFCTEK